MPLFDVEFWTQGRSSSSKVDSMRDFVACTREALSQNMQCQFEVQITWQCEHCSLVVWLEWLAYSRN